MEEQVEALETVQGEYRSKCRTKAATEQPKADRQLLEEASTRSLKVWASKFGAKN